MIMTDNEIIDVALMVRDAGKEDLANRVYRALVSAQSADPERIVYAAAWGSAFGQFQAAEWVTEVRKQEEDRDAEHASIVAQSAVDRFRMRDEEGKLWRNQHRFFQQTEGEEDDYDSD